MNAAWCCATTGAIRLSVQVMPNAKKSEVAGLFNEVLKIRLQAQPIEGKANEALIRYLADMLDVPKSAITITHGQSAKRKTLRIDAPGMTAEVVSTALLPRPGGR